ncbi:multiple inositol polyphosphate phosphatase 1 [Orussus abietinus]|uniref:multiple inositol polyphosphate phosphatase 1 n=1 Tax=Orussus abietinus TaxID=222816 RepID=UPI000624FE64|nr:multiple inositol polyphosphate phosphatase 1 [Orussus abietinus]XP_012271844.1 multiple inositol polyphosphate phosphatase 1 [Orussus abietinus]XP_012271845.1 multiple inositol polyphosphate phosphatase 1 [Orussus abietinus]XP_012271846.1 multiple inositol polyphosphate phosphatase 1 [Orussus abietinus]
MYPLVLALSLMTAGVMARDVDYCFAEEEDPYLFMGMKTAYHFVMSGRTRYQNIPDCEPIQIWMIARHGTRYPSSSEVTKLQTLPKLRDQIVYSHENRGFGHLCNQDLENLKRWRLDPNVNLGMAKQLTAQGEEDMRLLARRLQSNFPELLQPNSGNITAANYKFRTTSEDRTRASMELFMEGLFGSRTALPHEENPGNDTLLHANKACGSWEATSENNTIIEEEDTKFMMTPPFENLVHNVSRRLGFLHNISTASLLIMYDMCRYEKAWSVSNLSPWCAVFAKEELKVLEYEEDLYSYYYSGYGREVNEKLGCPPLKDMFDHFRKLERGDFSGQPKGVFSFSHSTPLQLLMTTMGIAKDSEPLTATNYNGMSKRKWRTSFLGPFASNIVAVFYRCKNPEYPNKVIFYQQESPILFEGCNVGLCDWEYLKNKYNKAVSECDLNFCWDRSGASSNFRIDLTHLLLLLVIFVCY